MTELYDLVGRERSLPDVAQTIHDWAQTHDAAEVGALHVTCSDESERECVEALQRGFIEHLLPALKSRTSVGVPALEPRWALRMGRRATR